VKITLPQTDVKTFASAILSASVCLVLNFERIFGLVVAGDGAQDDGDNWMGTKRTYSIISGYLNNSAETIKAERKVCESVRPCRETSGIS
jgi:hypothetical protein